MAAAFKTVDADCTAADFPGFPRHQCEIKVPALDLGDIRLLELSGNPLGAVRGRLCSHIQESLHGRACDLRPVFLTIARAQCGPGKELLR
jgi:hypothetical protein